MEKVVNKKLNKCQTIFVSIISAMAVLLFVIFKLGVSYETNDDRIINEIFQEQ